MEIITDIKRLRVPSEVITSKNDITHITLALEHTLKNTENGIGLSAIQIGISKRISIVRMKVGKRVYNINLINSNIIVKYGLCKEIEGCLSLPGKQVKVERFYHIQLDNREWYHGKIAGVIQHELDHWEGILITDKETK